MNDVKHGKIGIHTLTAYPPANLNRDEDGRPKTAMVGGVERLRVSSQARKRPWRLSDAMADVDAQISVRTRDLGKRFKEVMIENGASEKVAEAAAMSVASVFGTLNKKKGKDLFKHQETVVYGREEWDAAIDLANRLAEENREPSEAEVADLPRHTVSIDVAMFGRMRAAQTKLNVDSAIAVSPLLSTHAVAIEADNWTALDDLDPVGSGGMGEIEFASAIMYGFVSIDVDSLLKNLDENKDVAREGIAALMNAIALVSPQAMRSRFAQDTLPSLYRVEVGPAVYSHQSAFSEPITGRALISDSINRLSTHADQASQTYSLDLSVYEATPETSLNQCIQSVLNSVF
jgi:CRISPR system Cascade subunit CasC